MREAREARIVMRNVLVALKDRGEAARLAAVVAALAGPGAQVNVAHVLEGGSRGDFAEADLAVAQAVDVLRTHGITARGHVDVMGEGGVAGRLAERARASGAEVVVIGSRGLGEVRGLVAGSISHALPARLDLPVLVLPDRAGVPTCGPRRVLVAVGSEGDPGAAVVAVRLLGGPAIEVLAVHVARRVALHAGDAVSEPFLEIGETSTAVLATALDQFKRAGLRIATCTVDRDGGVAAAICDTARDWDADLIVLGPRRPGAWEALAAGSTFHRVLRHSDRPVLIAGRASP
jgi:nucleotide-binding universal stress UspA family protein